MDIPISLVSIWTPTGTKSATVFHVQSINYLGANGASADCSLRDINGVEVAHLGSIKATPAQCAAWTDDDAFLAVLATNANLTPA